MLCARTASQCACTRPENARRRFCLLSISLSVCLLPPIHQIPVCVFLDSRPSRFLKHEEKPSCLQALSQKVKTQKTRNHQPNPAPGTNAFDGKVGDSDASCIEITGYGPETKSYPTHTYYNTGLTNDWVSVEQEGAWTLTGDKSEMKALSQSLTPVPLYMPPHRRSNHDALRLQGRDVQLKTFLPKLSI